VGHRILGCISTYRDLADVSSLASIPIVVWAREAVNWPKMKKPRRIALELRAKDVIEF
jgi:hypothetical protein